MRDERRVPARQRGYNGRWEKARATFLQQYPLCGDRPGGRAPVMSRCRDEGRVMVATQVDHVAPHRGNQVLFWDVEQNWQSLCRSCGARKSQAGL